MSRRLSRNRALATTAIHSSDEDLVQAIRTGHTDSLGVLVTRWEQPLHRFVYRMLPAKDDVQDVVQETFLRVLNKAHRFKQGSRFSTWMYQIALNLCRDRMRRSRRWSRVLSEDAEINDEVTPTNDASAGNPADSAQRREMKDAVMKAMDHIPAAQREVLILKEFEGLKFREIARILDCPESTVKSRVYGGLNGLRQALERRGITSL